jgi:4-amino-4-deoxy-L-arabinose transferase-like glycosyltransferase
MSGLLRVLANQRLWPLWVVVITMLVLLPRLGAYGFWEPQEMAVAARALPATEKEIADKEAKQEAARKRDEARLIQQAKKAGGEPPTAADFAKATATRLSATKAQESRPPLADTLVKKGLDVFGTSEFAARFPFVLLALLTALITFFLGVRVRSARAGLIAATVLLACPLFVFQARQLTSELGAMAGGALMLLAAIGLCSPKEGGRAPVLYVLDALYLVAGSGLGYYSSGFFVGVLAPVAAIAIAASVSAFVDSPTGEAKASARLHLRIAGIVSVLVFVVLALYFTLHVFDWVAERQLKFSHVGSTFHFEWLKPGELEFFRVGDALHFGWAAGGDTEFFLFGGTFQADGEYNQLLAGAWKHEGNLKINFNSLFEQIAFGMFPWIALAPIAVARITSANDSATNPLAARLLFAWAATAWLICTIALRKVGPVQFTAVPAIAVAIAVWVDQLIDGRAMFAKTESGSESKGKPHSFNLAPPLLALFVLFAVVILAKDIKSFPATFLQVHLDSSNLKFPTDIKLHKILMVLGGLFGLCLAAWLYFWKPAPAEGTQEDKLQSYARSIGTWALLPTIGISLVISIFLSQAWTPALSTKLSSRATFSAFRALHEDGNKLGIMGKATDGANFYAKAPFEQLTGRPALINFLRSKERVFALVPASDLCPLHKESTNQGFDYYVVDDTNADKIMVSNRMWNKDVPPPKALHPLMRDFLDRNPLSRYIVREKPQNISKPLDINFDDKLQLIGVDMPDTASRGSDFTMRLYYKVLKPIRRGFQVFVHFDGAGVRFQGDHWPVNKRCGTNYWQPGAYVIDEFKVEAGTSGHAATTYQVWTGLFVGSAGNWENMKAVTGNPDDNNRVKVGTLRLK